MSSFVSENIDCGNMQTPPRKFLKRENGLIKECEY